MKDVLHCGVRVKHGGLLSGLRAFKADSRDHERLNDPRTAAGQIFRGPERKSKLLAEFTLSLFASLRAIRQRGANRLRAVRIGKANGLGMTVILSVAQRRLRPCRAVLKLWIARTRDEVTERSPYGAKATVAERTTPMIPKYLAGMWSAVSSTLRGILSTRHTGKTVPVGLAGFLTVALPVSLALAKPIPGLQSAPPAGSSSAAAGTGSATPKFEVASVKVDKTSAVGRRVMFRIMDPPDNGRFYANGPTLRMLLRMAYDVQDSQIIGGPSWINSEHFDIQAKADSAVDAELRKLSADQALLVKHRMLQALLADRFNLKLRHETRQLPVYALVVAKNGPKVHEVQHAGTGPRPASHAFGSRGFVRFQSGGQEQQITSQDTPMSFLAQLLSQRLGRTVLDKTGLTGSYNFTLKWTPDATEGQMFGGAGPGGGPGFGGTAGPGSGTAPPGSAAQGALAETPSASGSSGSSGPSDSSAPSIFTALQQQLGLRLKSEKGPVEVLVIDHVEPPSPD
jgi:uncharacterized protein (TIGR03435 family)